MLKGLFFFVHEGWKYDPRYILWNIFRQLVQAPLPIIAALMPRYMIDELMGERRAAYLLGYAAVLAGYTLVAAALSHYLGSDGFTRRCRVSAEFDSDLHRRLYTCDYANLESSRFLDMQERAKKFLYCNWHGFGYLLDCAMNILGHVLTLLGAAAIIAGLHPAVIVLLAALTLLGAATDSRARRRVKALDDAVVADQRGWTYHAGLFERPEYGKEFRVHRAGEWMLGRERTFFSRANANLKKQNDAYIAAGTATAFFTFLEHCAVYGYLIACALSGEISVGDFTMYAGTVTVFANACREVTAAFVEIRAYDMYYADLEEYLAVPAALRSGHRRVDPSAAHVLEFCHVSFCYGGSVCDALHDVNIVLHPGRKLLIVGENGAGKSTFIKLLLRLYEPTEGQILLDGTDIREYDTDSYMALFSTVLQDYRLFAFSLRENVALGLPADDARMERILRRVGLGEKLDSLERGLDTPLYKEFSEEGFGPSGGEGQKIAIARALYRDAPIVILDEPTAALDPRAEQEIYRQFDGLVRGKTAIYISHRLSSARFCDDIAVFDGGCIAEYGSHEELLRADRKYAELFALQAEFYR